MIRTYENPSSVKECLDLLSGYGGRGRLIAGGTDLMPRILAGTDLPEALIDTAAIEGFDRLEQDGDRIVIGAGVTHARLSRDREIRRMLPALARACESIGSPQIRNVATLAGNVVNAQPAADSAIALVALGASAEIAAGSGARTEPVEDLYAGVGASRISPSRELLTAFHVPGPAPGRGTAYGRISPRTSLCLPIVNAAVCLDTRQGSITSCRISLGPVADRPFRPLEAEALLVGADGDDQDAFDRAASAAARASSPRDSCFRGCSEYRRHLIRILSGTVLREAARRALNAQDHRLFEEDSTHV